MSLTTILQNACSPTIESCFKRIGVDLVTSSRSVQIQKVHVVKKTKSLDLDDFISELCAEDPRLDATISEGTKWVADTFYAEKPESFKVVRMKAGFTQASLADAVGTSQSHINKIERGEMSPRMDVIGRIAAVLSMDPKEVFGLLFAEYEKKNERS